jgi:hypothetical protein
MDDAQYQLKLEQDKKHLLKEINMNIGNFVLKLLIQLRTLNEGTMRIKQALSAFLIQGSGLNVITHYVEPKNSPLLHQYIQRKWN